MSLMHNEQDKLKVFISYSRTNLDFADQLFTTLQWQGFQPSIDRHGIHGAEEWEKRLGQLILEADIVVFVLSPASAKSEICAWEVQTAHHHGKRVIPVVCEPLDGIAPPERLRDLNFIFFYPDPSVPTANFVDGQVQLVDALSLDVEWLREHTRLEELAARWDLTGRKDDQLVRGTELLRYREWRDRRPSSATELTDLQRTYLSASEVAQNAREDTERRQLEERERLLVEAEEAQNDRQKAQQEAVENARRAELQARRVAHRTMIGLSVALLLAGLAAWFAYQTTLESERAEAQARQAKASAERARKEKERADRQRDQSLLAQSNFLSGFSRENLKVGEIGNAVSLAMRAIQLGSQKRGQPSAGPALQALYDAYSGNHFAPPLVGHSSAVLGLIEISRGRLLTWGADKTARVWRLNGAHGAVLRGHTENIWGAIELPDGSIATWSGDGTARLWSNDGVPTVVLKGHEGGVAGLKQLGDKRLLTWSLDSTARLWSKDGKLNAILRGHRQSVAGAIELRDGRIVTWAYPVGVDLSGAETTIRIWTAEGRQIATLDQHENGIVGVRELRGGKLLTWGDDGSVGIWESNGSLIRLQKGHIDTVHAAVELWDGRVLTWSAGDRYVKLWKVDESAPPSELDNLSEVRGALELSDRRLLTWGVAKTLRLWTQDGKLLRVLEGHSDLVVGATELFDKRLLTWGKGGEIRVWEKNGSRAYALKGHTESVVGVKQTSNGRIFSWDEKPIIRQWSLNGPVLKGHSSAITGAVELKNGNLVSWTGSIWRRPSGPARMWNTNGTPGPILTSTRETTLEVKELSDEEFITVGLAGIQRWSNDGTQTSMIQSSPIVQALELDNDRLISLDTNSLVQIWDKSGARIKALNRSSGKFAGIQKLTNGSILTWGDDESAHIWRGDGEFVSKLIGHTSKISGAVALKNGRILTWSEDNTARMWNPNGSRVSELVGHVSSISGGLELKDGRILTWSSDATARLWSSNGTLGPVLAGHTSGIDGALELSTGRLLTWNHDEARMWNADGKEESILKGHKDPGVFRLGAGRTSSTFAFSWHFLELRDGRLLSTARGINNGDSDARLWSSDGSLLAVLKGHTQTIWGASELSDGTFLTWSADNTARLWASDGSPVAVLNGHSSDVFGAIELRDGRILTWSEDGTARFWLKKRALTRWADEIVSKHRPLTNDELCLYYLRPTEECKQNQE